MPFSHDEAPKSGWTRESHGRSMPEVHASIPIRGGQFMQRMAAFLGPGYLVAVGYMDPGNWATSIAGGSAFGYTLLSVVLLSSLMAILLQALSLRLGVASGRDLAQACHDSYPTAASYVLWIMAELAIIATDLAEVIGTAVGLNLLFNIPLQFGVPLTALDVFLILWLQGRGFRRLEAMVFALTMVIAVSFSIEMIYAQPVLGDVLRGFVPQTRIVTSPAMLYLALGILGATVMPHNLFLHSAVIQTRRIGPTRADKREAIRMGTIDSTMALMFALLVNAAILILAAAAFHTRGRTDVAEIQQAFQLIGPILGAPLAAVVFAVALLASGLNSTVTATLSGQIVMEGFINIRLRAWIRRLLTRGLAIIPAVIVTVLYGESGTARLLVLSQVVLSLQLPFTIIPLVVFTANREKMNGLQAPRWMTVLAWVIAVVVIALNIKLIWGVATGTMGP